MTTYAPDRILIEPSGVGKLSEVITAVQNTKAEGIVLNTFTTVVDAGKAKMYMKNFGEFFNNQVEHANCIVFSHTDKTSPEKVEQALRAACAVSGVLEDPAVFVSVTNYGDSAIEYVVRAWCDTDNYWDVHFAITHNIKAQFDANGIEMTYPHLNVHLDK